MRAIKIEPDRTRQQQGESHMECQNCHGKWETDQSRSASLASCPFCGKSLASARETQFHDNSRDALRAIAETYGIVTFGAFGGKPLNWRVLDVDMQEGRALLLTEDIIEKRPYHSGNTTKITWEECALREYLNGAFLNNFGSGKSRIAQTKNDNPDNQWSGTKGGNSTTDRVFLLSIGEAVNYFGDSGQLKKRPKNSWWIDDQHNSKRIAKYENQAWGWWLRSPGSYSYRAASVDTDGNLYVNGYDTLSREGGVRPALWLNL
jgi:hypothetical protein